MKRILKRRPQARQFTDARGYKTPDAPASWPFGMTRPRVRVLPKKGGRGAV